MSNVSSNLYFSSSCTVYFLWIDQPSQCLKGSRFLSSRLYYHFSA